MAKGNLANTSAMNVPILAGAPNPQVYEIEGDDKSNQADWLEKAAVIISRLATLAKEQVTAKSHVEERWLKNVRDYHGHYKNDTEKQLKDAKQSRVFVKLTRAKTVTLEARLFDLIFPTDDRNWGIEATPVPRLKKELKQAQKSVLGAVEAANDAEGAGLPQKAEAIAAEGNDQAERIKAAEAEIARATEAADAMQEEMDDQLVESLYPQESRKMIGDACKLGSGVLKGPVVNESGSGRWMPSLDNEGKPVAGQFVLEYGKDPRPLIKRTNPWHFFPDMSATCIEEAEFTFERYLWTKKDLRKMVKTHNFNKDAVRRLLDDTSTSARITTSDLQYLMKIREATGEGETSDGIKGRLVGWEYHGPLERDEISCLLRITGQQEEADAFDERNDSLDEMNVICFFCGNELLKIAPEYPLDSGETLYSVFNVEESEASIFGYGIPEIMDGSSTAINSTWRAALDNNALSVGPQVIIDKEQIVPADNNWAMTPRKVWLRTKAAQPNTAAPIEFFNVPNNMAEIASIIKIALEFVDMETGISQPLQGEQGNVTQTVGGMAILQNASNIIFRRIVKNYDDGAITPTMRRLYHWNMQFNPRDDIKGDMNVDARGTSVLLMKEIQAQNLMFVVQQLLQNPSVAPMLKPYENVMKLFQSMMISPDEVMETKDKWQENVAAQAEAAQQQPDPVTIQAQSRIEAANIAAKSRAMSDNIAFEIAQMKERTAMLELVQSGELTLEQYRTEIAKIEKSNESKERMMAAELGWEKQNADDARARGEDPSGSGGYVSAGSDEDKKADGQ